MKTLVLIITLWFSAVTIPAFSQEVQTIDIKEMAKMAQIMKGNQLLINDPKAMSAMKQLVANLDKNLELKALLKNPEGLAAMMRLAGSFKAAEEVKTK